MRASVIGLFTGLILGLAYVLSSFGQMLVVALFGAIGLIVAKVLESDLDVASWLASQSSKRS